MPSQRSLFYSLFQWEYFVHSYLFLLKPFPFRSLFYIFIFSLHLHLIFSVHTAVMVIDWYRLADGTLFAPFRMFSLVCDFIIVCDVMWWFLVWFPVCDIIKKCVIELVLFAMALVWWCRAHWWVSSLIYNKEKTTKYEDEKKSPYIPIPKTTTSDIWHSKTPKRKKNVFIEKNPFHHSFSFLLFSYFFFIIPTSSASSSSSSSSSLHLKRF